ncbi:Leucine-rich repeat-containing protein 51, partial [Quaeritorhiza haematococci]
MTSTMATPTTTLKTTKMLNRYADVESKVSKEWAVVPGAPLDFTFKELTNVDDITTEEPRPSTLTKPKARPETKLIPTSIRLSNNKLTSITNLPTVVSQLSSSPEWITWIDLSFNNLSSIDETLTTFPNLQTLYLHANALTSLPSLTPLSTLTRLRSLTLHGNPVEHVKGYR